VLLDTEYKSRQRVRRGVEQKRFPSWSWIQLTELKHYLQVS